MRNRPPASNEAPARGGDSGASGGGNLTPRQLEVLELLAKGLSNQDICRLLGISANTVKAHVAAILRSLGVENRTEAASAHQRVVQAGHRAAVRARAARQVRRPAIAVLPFVNLADAADRDRLAAGLVDDLITRLAGWRWFPVIASAVSGRFPADQSDLEQVRRELGAAYLIRGSVRQLDARIRIAARLLESEHGRTIWSGSFETKVEDLFAAQDETARRIVACLAPELMDVEGDRVRTAAAGDFGAWHLTAHAFRAVRDRLPVRQSCHRLGQFPGCLRRRRPGGLEPPGAVARHHADVRARLRLTEPEPVQHHRGGRGSRRRAGTRIARAARQRRAGARLLRRRGARCRL